MNPFAQYLSSMNQQPSYPNNLANMFVQNSMFQQPIRIPRVNGKKGAEAYQMPNGSEVLLLDNDEPIIWMVQTDDAGTKTINALDVTEHIDADVKNY